MQEYIVFLVRVQCRRKEIPLLDPAYSFFLLSPQIQHL